MTALLVVGGALISVEGAAAGLSLGLTLSWLLNVKWLEKTAGLFARPFYWNGGRFLAAGVAAAGAVVVLSRCFSLPMGFGLLLLQILGATLLFWGLVAVSPAGRRDMRQGLTALKTFRR